MAAHNSKVLGEYRHLRRRPPRSRLFKSCYSLCDCYYSVRRENIDWSGFDTLRVMQKFTAI